MATRASTSRHITTKETREIVPALVRHILPNHGYPPDLREEAVLEQAETLCADWRPDDWALGTLGVPAD